MRKKQKSSWSRIGGAFLGVGLLGASGCGGSGPATHRVEGTLQVAEGNLAPLAGQTVEASLTSNPEVRAYGQIGEDGKFKLQTLQGGKIRRGALEGKYDARVVLSDDEPEQTPLAKQSVHPRFLQFQTSGLSFQVPAAQPVTLSVSAK